MKLMRILLCYMMNISHAFSYVTHLYLTNWENISETHEHLQHDCLYISMSMSPESSLSIFKMLDEPRDFRHITSLCLSEWPSKWRYHENKRDPKFTFSQLVELRVTSQQLYDWSSPIDIIESYEFHLNHLSLSDHVFYNCTMPRFGPECQYEFYSELAASFHSIHEFIHARYALVDYKPTALSCFEHITCDLGSSLLCLDWNNICDGLVQCIDGIDEKDCWQIEVNECNQDEYRCRNGQCIPLIFFDDHVLATECLDQSDRKQTRYSNNIDMNEFYQFRRPNFINEEVMMFNDTSYQRTDTFLPNRRHYYVPLMVTHQNSTNSDACFSALYCHLSFFGLHHRGCAERCPISPFVKCPWPEVINQTCVDSHMFLLPPLPIVLGHIYFAYSKQYLVEQSRWTNRPEYICYNEYLCDNFDAHQQMIRFNSMACRRFDDILPNAIGNSDSILMITNFIRQISIHLMKCNTISNSSAMLCDNRTMYQCLNSTKCIAKIRILDQFRDCDYGDDEDANENILVDQLCSQQGSSTHFLCPSNHKCISRKLIRDSQCDCGYVNHEQLICPDEDMGIIPIRERITFSAICNGFQDLNPVLIDDQNHTDETECHQWLCNNTYTRCNGYWDCYDGADEIDCYPLLSNLNCTSPSFLCISPHTRDFICLPMNKGNNGIIDCLGGTDEPYTCRYETQTYGYGFFCKNRTTLFPMCLKRTQLCTQPNREPCTNFEMRKLCDMRFTDTMFINGFCDRNDLNFLTEIEQRICYLYRFTPLPKLSHFSLDSQVYAPKDQEKFKNAASNISFIRTKMNSSLVLQCHHGVPLKVFSDVNTNVSQITCLCLPNYYGDRCQYQNERVSFTLKLATFSDSWQTQFILIILLVDDSSERIIHSYEQITYLPKQHCQRTFDIYLIYSSRPKQRSKDYSIHIDIYERLSLDYRGSLYVAIPFQFLPVQRVASLLMIPPRTYDMRNCFLKGCLHGECIRYFHDSKQRTFCRCHPEWTGRLCTIRHICTCSSHSVCYGISANNRSICLCRTDKWGPRCLLSDPICQRTNLCHNNGTCIPIDQHVSPGNTFVCICPDGFYGKHCELSSHRIVLSFSHDLHLSSTMFIHFIEVKLQQAPEIGITFKKIPRNRNPVTIYWSQTFHISFVELFISRYYLISVRETNQSSRIIRKTIRTDDYCPHVRELFDETFSQLHLIRRIKYFHVPCRNFTRKLSCFYDDNYFCLCIEYNQQRQANCFEFNRTLKHDCSGRSLCENGGQCLQDSSTCPQSSMCVCPSCFYGSRCQFTSNGHSISLDAILGYHIQPHISLSDQPKIVQISLIITLLIFTVGFINGICSLITFKKIDSNGVGCGIYLLVSSLTTIFNTMTFVIKFLVLLTTHMKPIRNRSFLMAQCVMMDYIIRIGLYMDQWLNAFIAFERAMMIIKGVNFKKKQSMKIAKWAILILLIVTATSNIIDPLHQRLLEEIQNDEHRIWCVLTYSPTIHLFNIIMNVFHFCLPFLINLLSATIILIFSVRYKASTQINQTYRKHLKKQFDQHRHLFISSFLLFILAVPRLVFMFSRGCMKTDTDSWWFLMGYFVSFFPPMLNFIIFVIPSKVYIEKFQINMLHYRQAVRRHLHLIR